MNKLTYVGLDVHTRSVKGCAIDRETGEILRQTLAANDAGIAEWVTGLPSPMLVVYEAGPTGFGLARPPAHRCRDRVPGRGAFKAATACRGPSKD